MKPVIYFTILISLFLGFAAVVCSGEEPEKKVFIPKYRAGAGLILGSPTGLSGKFWLPKGKNDTRYKAVDVTIAWSAGKNSGLYLHGDWLVNSKNAYIIEGGQLPLYYGFGINLSMGEKTEMGVRIPLGAEYFFQTAPVALFLEIVPGLTIIDKTSFQLHGGIGARYYFN